MLKKAITSTKGVQMNTEAKVAADRCPLRLTKHHRKPSSLGGKDTLDNYSWVPNYKHAAWHILFDNLPAYKMEVLFKVFYKIFGSGEKPSKTGLQKRRRWVKKSRRKANKLAAWEALFSNLSIREMISEINRVWIDPEFCLTIETKRIEKIRVQKRKSRSS